MIEVKHIAKTYYGKDNFIALKDINLTVKDGEILGIVGYSGAGKSTLLRLFNGLLTPTAGLIAVDGVSVNYDKQKALNRMRQQMGMIFQHFNLIQSMTVYQNIKLALDINQYPKDKDKRIRDLLDYVSLSDKWDKFPVSLSGGEQQRVAIARALANEPAYLLCDEATSALDMKTAFEIVDILKRVQKDGVTVIFVSHQIEVIEALCDRVVVMDKGVIVEENTAKNIFTSPQHDVTKSLVKQAVYDQNQALYELIYSQKNSEQTAISDMVKRFDVDVNIQFGKTLSLKDETIGFLYIDIIGKDKEQAIKYLEEKGIKVNQHD
ncbi:MAG: methionine ABC transporter ATP-binding protein [Acholeplasma sp.]|jgi:D-methionine transport system ATP-binding protein|nr:methionine ABC transporter ATP-binding protein [Acholeplasma sp.]